MNSVETMWQGLQVFNLPALCNIDFYSKQPEDLPCIDEEHLKQYKLKK